MRTSYPFTGVVRFALLPLLILAAGVLSALIDERFTPDLYIGYLEMSVLGASFVFPIATGLAVGRHPLLAAATGFVLGLFSFDAAELLLKSWSYPISFDSDIVFRASSGAASALVVLAHHRYLAMRGTHLWRAIGGLLFFMTASAVAARLTVVDSPAVWSQDILRRATVGGVLQWVALLAALKANDWMNPPPPMAEASVKGEEVP